MTSINVIYKPITKWRQDCVLSIDFNQSTQHNKTKSDLIIFPLFHSELILDLKM